MKRIALVFLVMAGLAGCREENLEKADFNVYFYYPKSSGENVPHEEFLGLVTGLSSCQRASSSKAASLNMSRSSGWGYICCKKTSTSNCESKHK